MKLWLVSLISFIIFSIGGGIGYIIWLRTRPKVQTWVARCYQLGDGIVKRKVLNNNKHTGEYMRLKDLKPYIIDTLQKIEKKSGTIYRLVIQNLTTTAVTADMVDNWGKGQKEVNVLIDGTTAILLKKNYDQEGTVLLRPMKRERIEMIKSELTIQKERYTQAKGMLQSLIPWVGVGLMIMGMVAVGYFASDAFIKISDNLAKQEEQKAELIALKEDIKQLEEDKYGIKPVEPQGKDPPDIE